jgi:hypothetical protein
VICDSGLVDVSRRTCFTARAVRASAGQGAGKQVADHGKAAALVQTERQDGAEWRVVHHARLGCRLAPIIPALNGLPNRPAICA